MHAVRLIPCTYPQQEVVRESGAFSRPVRPWLARAGAGGQDKRVFCTLIKKNNNNWHLKHSPQQQANDDIFRAQILPVVPSRVRRCSAGTSFPGDAAPKCISQFPRGYLPTSAHSSASSPGCSNTAPLFTTSLRALQGMLCIYHNLAFNILILLDGFPF